MPAERLGGCLAAAHRCDPVSSSEEPSPEVTDLEHPTVGEASAALQWVPLRVPSDEPAPLSGLPCGQPFSGASSIVTVDPCGFPAPPKRSPLVAPPLRVGFLGDCVLCLRPPLRVAFVSGLLPRSGAPCGTSSLGSGAPAPPTPLREPLRPSQRLLRPWRSSLCLSAESASSEVHEIPPLSTGPVHLSTGSVD
jgi:hypothetical protein